MLKQFVCDLKLRKERMLAPLALMLAGFGLGFGLLCAVMFLDDDPGTWFCVGSFLAMVVLMIYGIFSGFGYCQEFMLALSMGRTRGEFMVSYALRTLLTMGVGYAVLMGLAKLELTVGSDLFAAYPLEGEMTFLMDWRFAVAAILGVTALSMFIGALYSFFGKKALAPLYFIWMALCILGPRLTHEENLAVLGVISAPVWAVIGIAAVAAMAVTTVALGRKQMVR